MEKIVRVLIVEDDFLAREAIKNTVEVMDGYVPVGEAADGLEAVRMTRTLKPDVILMDIRIPALDGIEAARRISDLCPTPVVVTSAFETPELVKRASEAGVGAYLLKPAKAKDVERSMAIAMARHEDLMELRRLNQTLQARNEDVEAFVNTVAHEVQNPLALLIGFAEALRKYRHGMSDEDLDVSLENIEQSGWKISQIMDQLLLLAQAHKLEAEMEPLDTGSIVAHAQERLVGMIEEHDARIIVPDTWPVPLGQSSWVEEVWVNCLHDAIKNSRSTSPTLELDATALPDGMVQFWIKDNGCRVEPGEHDSIFDPLPQRRKGYGIRMSLVRRIVDRLGGYMEVESNAGQTLYTFTLPGLEHQDQS